MRAAYVTATGSILALGSVITVSATGILSSGGPFERSLPFGALGVSIGASDVTVADITGAYPAVFSPNASHVVANGAIAQAQGWTPPAPPVATGRNLNRHEFLAVGMATDAAKINAVLAGMPVVVEFLDDYRDTQGIAYADMSKPGALLKALMDDAVAAQIITVQTVTDFATNWLAMYPAG